MAKKDNEAQKSRKILKKIHSNKWLLSLVLILVVGFGGWATYRSFAYPTNCNRVDRSKVSGCVPDDQMCGVDEGKWPGARLRCDAVQPFLDMNAAFESVFGKSITTSSQGGVIGRGVGGDMYRTLAQQVQCYRAKKTCITPGKSNHGWGLAIDVGDSQCLLNCKGTYENLWMWENACKYNFKNPYYRIDSYDYNLPSSKSKNEAWHFEYNPIGCYSDPKRTPEK